MTIEQLLKELRLHQVVLRLEQEKLLCELPKQGIPSVLRAELVARKEELKTYISSTLANSHAGVAIPLRSERQVIAPTSFAQQSLWMLDQFNNGSAHYNMPNALKLSGELNINALNQAFSSIFERHESLRSCFVVDDDGLPVQLIQPAPEFIIAEHDLTHLHAEFLQQKIEKLINFEAAYPFDLSKDLMLRGLLIKISESEYVLTATMHHIASDGWSVTIVIREFAQLYSAYCQGQPNPLAPLEIQYADYAHWQRLQEKTLGEQLDYWAHQLADLPIVHSVPLDYPRPLLQTTSGFVYSSRIDAVSAKTLSSVCHSSGATLYMGLHAVFSIFLARYSNALDIVVGTAIANREQPELANMIGYFINILVLRSDLSNNPSFLDVLQQSKNMLLDAYAHQQVPFSQLIDRLLPQGSLSYSPLCQIMLILQNTEEVTLELPGVTLSSIAQMNLTAKHDLTLYVTEDADGLDLSWEYNTDLFAATTIERMAIHFEVLLKSLLEQPAENVFAVEILNTAERQKVLQACNATAVPYPEDKCVHELFEQQVEKAPHAIALCFNDEQLSYAELNLKANRLAHHLISQRGVRPDTLVGIFVERSLDMVVAMLGILKAGGAYVPLDPNYPKARLAYMLDDANLATVVTQSHLLMDSPITNEQALCLDDAGIERQLLQEASNNIAVQDIGLRSDNSVYVIYTSGSTGNPKGVIICHNSLVNLVGALADRYAMQNTDTILQFAPISFDMSVEEIFPALCLGSRLVIRNNEWLDSIDTFYQHCQHNGITVLNLPTAFWHELARNEAPFGVDSVRHISVGGEKVSEIEIENWYMKETDLPTLLDAYGPTECTVNASFANLTPHSKNGIGTALANVSLYVLNPSLQLTPVNVAGELHIGGVGLARGYLNRPQLTDEKFIANPFYDSASLGSSPRLYKTGDQVRWLSDGSIEYLGRIDHQVKIRGYRIELGEVENALAACIGVREAVVLAKESAQGRSQLVGYVVMDADCSGDGNPVSDSIIKQQLLQRLSHSLPDYMLPTAFVVLETLPMTANGKVDRKALPEPDFTSQSRKFCTAKNETEEIICAIWQEVLGIDNISTTDNFFMLGGNSLLAIRALSRIKSECCANLSIRSLFLDPTVAGIAKFIETQKLNNDNLNSLFDKELVEEGFF